MNVSPPPARTRSISVFPPSHPLQSRNDAVRRPSGAVAMHLLKGADDLHRHHLLLGFQPYQAHRASHLIPVRLLVLPNDLKLAKILLQRTRWGEAKQSREMRMCALITQHRERTRLSVKGCFIVQQKAPAPPLQACDKRRGCFCCCSLLFTFSSQ